PAQRLLSEASNSPEPDDPDTMEKLPPLLPALLSGASTPFGRPCDPPSTLDLARQRAGADGLRVRPGGRGPWPGSYSSRARICRGQPQSEDSKLRPRCRWNRQRGDHRASPDG